MVGGRRTLRVAADATRDENEGRRHARTTSYHFRRRSVLAAESGQDGSQEKGSGKGQKEVFIMAWGDAGAPRDAVRAGDFEPHPAMRKFIYTGSLLLLAVCVLPWSIPVMVSVEELRTFAVVVNAITLAIAIWIVVWARMYHGSIKYRIDEEWLYAEGGVIWKRRSRLPISRVQLVNIVQGPWQRRYGLASLRVYTAATGQATAELSYANIADAEAIRDHVLRLVHRQRAGQGGLGDDRLAAFPGGSSAGVGSAEADQTQMVELLSILVREVRAIRQKLGG